MEGLANATAGGTLSALAVRLCNKGDVPLWVCAGIGTTRYSVLPVPFAQRLGVLAYWPLCAALSLGYPFGDKEITTKELQCLLKIR
jgi:hypothetical protein